MGLDQTLILLDSNSCDTACTVTIPHSSLRSAAVCCVLCLKQRDDTIWGLRMAKKKAVGRRKNHIAESTDVAGETSWNALTSSQQAKIVEAVKSTNCEHDSDPVPLLASELNIVVDIDAEKVSVGGRSAELYLARCMELSSRISKVFALLDDGGKGCVVANDIVHVSSQLGGDQVITEEEAVEMVDEFAGDEGVLTLQQLAQIASEVNL